ncbi:MAG: DUF1573 domain-containing protein [Patescibacteria group bacterium]
MMKSIDNRLIIFTTIIIVLVVGGIIAILMVNFEEKNQLNPKIGLDLLEYDFGTISIADGPVRYTYKIKNIGEKDLKINGIQTSCMCTTAILRVGNNISPEFGMHSNQMLWSQKVVPGEIGYLEVVFDPAFHGPEATGEVVRAIYVSTNAPKSKKVELKFIANVVK